MIFDLARSPIGARLVTGGTQSCRAAVVETLRDAGALVVAARAAVPSKPNPRRALHCMPFDLSTAEVVQRGRHSVLQQLGGTTSPPVNVLGVPTRRAVDSRLSTDIAWAKELNQNLCPQFVSIAPWLLPSILFGPSARRHHPCDFDPAPSASTRSYIGPTAAAKAGTVDV